MKHDSLYILPCTQLCMIINENDDDCNDDDDDQSAVQLLLPKPQYGAEAKAGFSRLMCTAQPLKRTQRPRLSSRVE